MSTPLPSAREKWLENHPTYYRDLFNRLFDELRQLFGGRCKCCGSTLSLQFAHIKETGLSGRGRGKSRRYYDIKKHPDCYALLCEKCHKLLDSLSPEHKVEWIEKNITFNKENAVNIESGVATPIESMCRM